MGRFLFLIALLAALALPVEADASDKKGWRSALPLPATDADYYDNGAPDPAKVALGAQLFFDKVLSGNFNISCATCHHSFTGTSDGLALPIGEGGRGLGVTRDTGLGADAVHERVPRNAPHVFNLGAREFDAHVPRRTRATESRHARTASRRPRVIDLPEGLDNALAAQAMFPVTSGTEMAGQPGENPIADAAAAGNLAGPGGVWEQLAERLQGLPGYVDQFIAVYPGYWFRGGHSIYPRRQCHRRL